MDETRWTYAATVVSTGQPATVAYYPQTQRAELTGAGECGALDAVGAYQLVPGARLVFGAKTVRIDDDSSRAVRRANPTASAQAAKRTTAQQLGAWHTTYTPDKTKKAKTWHDGAARIVDAPCGLQEVHFYDAEGRVMHRRRVPASGPHGMAEGALLDTARYIIEVGAPLHGSVPVSAPVVDDVALGDAEADPSGPAPQGKASAVPLGPCLFTADKTQRVKRFRDGTVRWDAATRTAIFYDDAGAVFHRRKCADLAEISAGIEFTTARYIVQVEPLQLNDVSADTRLQSAQPQRACVSNMPTMKDATGVHTGKRAANHENTRNIAPPFPASTVSKRACQSPRSPAVDLDAKYESKTTLACSELHRTAACEPSDSDINDEPSPDSPTKENMITDAQPVDKFVPKTNSTASILARLKRVA